MSKKFKTHRRGKVEPKVLETVREFFDKEQQKEELRKEFIREKRKNPTLEFKEWFKDKTSELKENTEKKEGLPDFVKEFLKGKRKESIDPDVRNMSDEEFEQYMDTLDKRILDEGF